MNYKKRALCLVTVTALCLASGSGQAQTPSSVAPSAGMPQGHMDKGADGAHDMKQSMMKSMDGMQKMSMSGDVDKDFATMMKMHHQNALEMSQMELEHGKSPQMKAMARSIISTQKKEIAQIERWITKQK